MSFKVGDRVKNLQTDGPTELGAIGTVSSVDNPRDQYEVLYDREEDRANDCDFKDTWTVGGCELVLVEEEVQLPKTEMKYPQVYKEETYKLSFGTDIITLTRGEIEQLQRKIGELL